MSDTHVDKDKSTHVNYDEILKYVTAGVVASAISPFGFLPMIYKVLRDLQKSKPTHVDNLREIIETGRKQGVSTLEIDIDKSIAAEIDLGVFTVFEGVDITARVQKENRTIQIQ